MRRVDEIRAPLFVIHGRNDPRVPVSEAEQLVAQIEALSLTFERKVGEADHLFGSVTSADIAHQLEAKSFNLDRRKIQLEEPLRSLGEFHVPVKLHREVTAHVKVTITAEAAE